MKYVLALAMRTMEFTNIKAKSTKLQFHQQIGKTPLLCAVPCQSDPLAAPPQNKARWTITRASLYAVTLDCKNKTRLKIFLRVPTWCQCGPCWRPASELGCDPQWTTIVERTSRKSWIPTAFGTSRRLVQSQLSIRLWFSPISAFRTGSDTWTAS